MPAPQEPISLVDEFGVEDYSAFLCGTWASETDPDGIAVVFRFDPDGSKGQAEAMPLVDNADPALWIADEWQVDPYTWNAYMVEGDLLIMREWDFSEYSEWTIEIYDEGTISISSGDGDSYVLYRIGEVVDSEALKYVGDYSIIGSNGNIYAVQDGPGYDLPVCFDTDVYVQSISTYHWNSGNGAVPGTISIEDEDGNVLGTWEAVGRMGYLDAPDAYWDVFPNIMLEADTWYYIVDSDNDTWSYNSESQGGMVEVRGYVFE